MQELLYQDLRAKSRTFFKKIVYFYFPAGKLRITTIIKRGEGAITSRIVSFFCAFVFALGLLGLKVMSLGKGDTVKDAATVQSSRTVTLSEGRAGIYDRNLSPLVNRETERKALIFPDLADLNVLKEFAGDEGLVEAAKSSVPYVMDTDGKIIEGEGIYNFEAPVRYSKDQLAVHIIGYMNDGSGASGIEHAYDEVLKAGAQKVTATYYADGTGRLLTGEDISVTVPDNKSVRGVVLTLDSKIQRISEKALAAGTEKGAAVVMDVENGEILAAASVPVFDPLNLSASFKNENAPFINRAFSSYTVGSTFKLVTAAAALEAGVSTGRTYDCKSSIEVEERIFKCHWEYGHGEIDMPAALRVSCNPYFIDLAMDIGGARILEMAKNLGFGSAAEFGPGFAPSAGKLPTEEEVSYKTSLSSFAFGQGKLMATPVQMAALAAAIANGGCAVTPSLVLGFYDEEGNFSETPRYESNRAMSEKTAALLREMMIGVVENGSGEAAKPETGGAGGKTASAQTGQFREDGSEIVHAWFVGFYPAENPKYAVAVLAEGMDSGGDFAAPIFKEICDGIVKTEEQDHF